jgi:hypothetical protein
VVVQKQSFYEVVNDLFWLKHRQKTADEPNRTFPDLISSDTSYRKSPATKK